jgi:multidrug resistance efflux pump
MSKSLKPVLTPASQRWREFRIQFIPGLVFILVLSVVVVIWREHVSAPMMAGEVESNTVEVISTMPGLLAELDVDRFSRVAKGQVIGRMFPTDPEHLKASIAALEMDLRVLRARMTLDEQRNELDYERLRLDNLTRRAELAAVRANLQQSRNELDRITKLHAEKIASDMQLDIAVRDHERWSAELRDKTELVAQVEQSLDRFVPANASATNPHPRAEIISAALEAQENKLALLEGPIELRAPVDGTISFIGHRPGERVMAGNPVVTISPIHSERIVGYVRQPVRFTPRVGDVVRVRTRGSQRQVGLAQVLRVGSDMQLITSPLSIRSFATLEDRGLPFLINVPAGMEVIPGELVDLQIVSQSAQQ